MGFEYTIINTVELNMSVFRLLLGLQDTDYSLFETICVCIIIIFSEPYDDSFSCLTQ